MTTNLQPQPEAYPMPESVTYKFPILHDSLTSNKPKLVGYDTFKPQEFSITANFGDINNLDARITEDDATKREFTPYEHDLPIRFPQSIFFNQSTIPIPNMKGFIRKRWLSLIFSKAYQASTKQARDGNIDDLVTSAVYDPMGFYARTSTPGEDYRSSVGAFSKEYGGTVLTVGSFAGLVDLIKKVDNLIERIGKSKANVKASTERDKGRNVRKFHLPDGLEWIVGDEEQIISDLKETKKVYSESFYRKLMNLYILMMSGYKKTYGNVLTGTFTGESKYSTTLSTHKGIEKLTFDTNALRESYLSVMDNLKIYIINGGFEFGDYIQSPFDDVGWTTRFFTYLSSYLPGTSFEKRVLQGKLTIATKLGKSLRAIYKGCYIKHKKHRNVVNQFASNFIHVVDHLRNKQIKKAAREKSLFAKVVESDLTEYYSEILTYTKFEIMRFLNSLYQYQDGNMVRTFKDMKKFADWKVSKEPVHNFYPDLFDFSNFEKYEIAEEFSMSYPLSEEFIAGVMGAERFLPYSELDIRKPTVHRSMDILKHLDVGDREGIWSTINPNVISLEEEVTYVHAIQWRSPERKGIGRRVWERIIGWPANHPYLTAMMSIGLFAVFTQVTLPIAATAYVDTFAGGLLNATANLLSIARYGVGSKFQPYYTALLGKGLTAKIFGANYKLGSAATNTGLLIRSMGFIKNTLFKPASTAVSKFINDYGKFVEKTKEFVTFVSSGIKKLAAGLAKWAVKSFEIAWKAVKSPIETFKNVYDTAITGVSTWWTAYGEITESTMKLMREGIAEKMSGKKPELITQMQSTIEDSIKEVTDELANTQAQASFFSNLYAKMVNLMTWSAPAERDVNLIFSRVQGTLGDSTGTSFVSKITKLTEKLAADQISLDTSLTAFEAARNKVDLANKNRGWFMKIFLGEAKVPESLKGEWQSIQEMKEQLVADKIGLKAFESNQRKLIQSAHTLSLAKFIPNFYSVGRLAMTTVTTVGPIFGMFLFKSMLTSLISQKIGSEVEGEKTVKFEIEGEGGKFEPNVGPEFESPEISDAVYETRLKPYLTDFGKKVPRFLMFSLDGVFHEPHIVSEISRKRATRLESERKEREEAEIQEQMRINASLNSDDVEDTKKYYGFKQQMIGYDVLKGKKRTDALNNITEDYKEIYEKDGLKVTLINKDEKNHTIEHPEHIFSWEKKVKRIAVNFYPKITYKHIEFLFKDIGSGDTEEGEKKKEVRIRTAKRSREIIYSSIRENLKTGSLSSIPVLAILFMAARIFEESASVTDQVDIQANRYASLKEVLDRGLKIKDSNTEAMNHKSWKNQAYALFKLVYRRPDSIYRNLPLREKDKREVWKWARLQSNQRFDIVSITDFFFIAKYLIFDYLKEENRMNPVSLGLEIYKKLMMPISDLLNRKTVKNPITKKQVLDIFWKYFKDRQPFTWIWIHKAKNYVFKKEDFTPPKQRTEPLDVGDFDNMIDACGLVLEAANKDLSVQMIAQGGDYEQMGINLNRIKSFKEKLDDKKLSVGNIWVDMLDLVDMKLEGGKTVKDIYKDEIKSFVDEGKQEADDRFSQLLVQVKTTLEKMMGVSTSLKAKEFHKEPLAKLKELREKRNKHMETAQVIYFVSRKVEPPQD